MLGGAGELGGGDDVEGNGGVEGDGGVGSKSISALQRQHTYPAAEGSKSTSAPQRGQ